MQRLPQHPRRSPSSLLFGLVSSWLVASTATAELRLEPLAPELPGAVAAVADGEGRLLVSLIQGRVVLVDEGRGHEAPFLDIRDRVFGADGLGLWSTAVLRDGSGPPGEGFLFVHYAERETADSVVARFPLVEGGMADAAAGVELLRIPKAERLHYGGQLAFGPDGMLFVSTGEGTGRTVVDPQCAAQSLLSLEGKILRLDVSGGSPEAPFYAVPPDNPFVHNGRGEIWVLGLRNPWRFSFDRQTGDLWISDVGHDRREEIDRQPATSSGGENYGWKVMEGSRCFGRPDGCPAETPECFAAELVPPLLEYAHDGGRCAVIGGHVYRGRLVPDLFGRYLYGDFCSGELWAAHSDGAGWVSELLPITLPGLVSFVEDSAGELRLVAGDRLHALRDDALPPAGLVELDRLTLETDEEEQSVPLLVHRVGGAAGAVRVSIATRSGTATAGEDFEPLTETLAWEDGESGTRQATLQVIDDELVEGEERLTVELSALEGGARLGARSSTQVVLLDSEACRPGPTRLCLQENRFRVSVTFRTAEGVEGEARAERLSPSGGFFWFFQRDNPEIFVKVLDACIEPFEHFWVFAAGLTDVATTLTVLDTGSGEVRTYETLPGEDYTPIRDTRAFSTCP